MTMCEGLPMRAHQHRGFSLPELLIVLCIIALLLSMLMPALSRARQRAQSLKCQAQLHQIGIALTAYAQENAGELFPHFMGASHPPEERWPVTVMDEPFPPVLICPSDSEQDYGNSYLLNSWLPIRGIRFGGGTPLGGLDTTQIVVMGEKGSWSNEYYMDGPMGDYADDVELYRHGGPLRSNYLYLDMHVDNEGPIGHPLGLDPWDVPPELPPVP
jgi:prepilin-type N-terminal cleavage/methylation domain-containing protein